MILPYIINAGLILGACLAFYKLLLRRETFYQVNRWLLITCLAISFALPLLPVPQQLSLRKKETTTAQKSLAQPVQQIHPNAGNTKEVVQTPAADNTEILPAPAKFSFAKLMTWLVWFYWFGVIIFAISFLFQVALLLWRSWRNPVIIDGSYRIVEMKGDKAPCSFGNTIFINPEKYDWETYSQILLHEKIHIRQKHTIDILIAELVLIFQWFNPFAWIYRREIESNLEFLTDDQLMQKNTVDKKSYQLSLVQVSTPHFPLSLTTNYNQSILKKRIAMMNRKRSNLHTAWKYFFLMPLLAFLACLLNEPVANSQTTDEKQEKNVRNHGMETQGYWFAVIKDDKVNIRFSSEKMESDNGDFKHSFSGETFKLSDLGNIPKGTPGTFTITREAGRMDMTGKFEGNTGMGTYKFTADKAFVDYMNAELKEKLDDDDQMAFFFINIKKEFLQMLKNEGYKDITKDDLIPVAALGIDQAYIRSIRNAGFKDVSLDNLVPLKALNVDEKYISDIKSVYKDISTDQLVSFKAQGIDKEYIAKVRQMKGDNKNDDDAGDIVSFKAMNIDEAFINGFKAVGYNNLTHDQLVSFKALNITPEYVKSWQDAGYKIDPEDLPGMKSQNVTPEYLKSFTDLGYKGVKPENLVAFRALGITPDYIKSFEAAGYKNIDLEQLPGLKSQNITPEFIRSFEAVGFKNIELDEIVAVKAVGVTPEYIKDMRAKGFNYNSLQKYVTLKSIDQ